MRKLTFVIAMLGLSACRSDSTGGPGPQPDAPGMGSNAGVSIKSVRMNPPADKTMVTFKNVVVTGHVSSKKYGHVWVQDAGGGQYSGIELFCNYGGTTPSCMMTQAQIDALAIGTVVDATGSFSNFLLSTAPAGAQPNMEINSPMITATGQTMTPVAVDVDAATVAHDQLAAPAAEPYKGAYVHVTGSATVSSKTAMEFASTCTDKSMPPMNGTTYGGFEATNGGKTLAIGLGFYNTVTYCLPCTGVAMPYPCTNPIATQTFTTVNGIVEPEYNANGQVYLQVSPTSDTDLH